MDIFLTGKSNVGDLVIDFLELKLKSGSIVALDWDLSCVERGRDGRFEAVYEGINIGGKSAHGKLSKFKGAAVTAVGLYSESDHKADLDILVLSILEKGKALTLHAPYSVRGAAARG